MKSSRLQKIIAFRSKYSPTAAKRLGQSLVITHQPNLPQHGPRFLLSAVMRDLKKTIATFKADSKRSRSSAAKGQARKELAMARKLERAKSLVQAVLKSSSSGKKRS